MEGAYYGGGDQARSSDIGMLKSINSPSLQNRLDLAVKQAEERLAKVKEARDILSRNPDLERLLNIMQQNHF